MSWCNSPHAINIYICQFIKLRTKTNRRLSGYEQFSMPQHNKCYLFFFETSITSEFGESLSWRCPRWAESFSINALFLNNSASSMISCTTEVWTSSEPFKLPTRSKIASSPAWQKESLLIKCLWFVNLTSDWFSLLTITFCKYCYSS